MFTIPVEEDVSVFPAPPTVVFNREVRPSPFFHHNSDPDDKCKSYKHQSSNALYWQLFLSSDFPQRTTRGQSLCKQLLVKWWHIVVAPSLYPADSIMSRKTQTLLASASNGPKWQTHCSLRMFLWHSEGKLCINIFQLVNLLFQSNFNNETSNTAWWFDWLTSCSYR